MATITAIQNKTGAVISYKIRCCVGRDDLGRQIWRVKHIKRPEGLTPKKERKQIEAEAAVWEATVRKEYEQQKEQDKHKRKMALCDFVSNKWFPDHVQNGRHTPCTIQFYKHMTRDILQYFGGCKVSELDIGKIERYEKYLRTEAQTQAQKPLSDTTVRRHLETLRAILRYAYRHGYCTEDIFAKYQIKNTSKKIEVDYLEPEEARDFVSALDDENIFYRTYVLLSMSCGLRRGEAVGLQWRDVDWDHKRLYIRRNVTVDKSSPSHYHIGATKSKQQRTVMLTDKLIELLLELKAEHEADFFSLPNSGFIFHSPTDPLKPIYPTTPTAWVRRFERRHNLRYVSPHDLRHTAGTLAIIAGANMKDIQTMLGHQDIQTTARYYIGIDEAAQKRTVEGIEALITPK